MQFTLLEIINKYRQKCEEIEEDIKRILQEEAEERELNRLEYRANQAEKELNGDKALKRSWFQTKKEREDEKGNKLN